MVESRRIEHTGRYWYFADNLVPEEGAEPVVRFWLAMPFTRPGQTVEIGGISPKPKRIHEDPFGGNRIAEFEVRELPSSGPLTFTVDFQVAAEEVRTAIDPASVASYDRKGAGYERYTRSEPWIEITPEIAAAAREAAAGEENPYLAAKRIFDFVIREMSYEYPDMDSRGAARSFERKKGDCGEFSAVFVAMCRAIGIPARTVTCNWFTGSGHQWAEFLCPPHGWVPVDASIAEAIRSGEERIAGLCESRGIPQGDPDWLFGNLYANRLVVFVGTNVEAGDRTFGMMQPAGEAAYPDSFEAAGCGGQVVHGGFYLFGEGHDDPGRALDVGRRELAKAYFDAGLHAQAEPGFLLTVEEKPRDSLAWFHLGQIRMNRGELEAAREALSNCIDGDAGSIQPVLSALSHLLRGNTYDLDGRREEAVADYGAVLESGVDFQGVDEAARGYLGTPFTGEE